MNRRDFIKTAAVGVGGGMLALETLSCRPSEPGDGLVPFADVHEDFPMEFTERTVPTTCWIGKQDCGMLARVLTQNVDGRTIERIIKVEGNPEHPRNLGTLCPKGIAQIQAVYDYNRIKWPMRRVNSKGQRGRFVRITWDEALNELRDELIEAKASQKPVLWQKGRSKAKKFYDDGFLKALDSWGGADMKATKIGHGAYCSDSGYRAAEYTLGYHGVISPDLSHTKYLFSWGWGLTTSGGNKFCWLTWPQKLLEARNRDTHPLEKVVVFDPNRRQTGPHGEEWLPTRPGADLAFFLGMCHYLINNTATGFDNGLIDETYLRNHTNATFLVITEPGHADEGKFLRIGGKEQVWTTAGAPADYDAAVTSELLGTFTYDPTGANIQVSTAFQAFKDHLNADHSAEGGPAGGYTPDWADGVCDLQPLTTARIARELFENSNIDGRFTPNGEITIDGVTMPYRPVSMMAYHVSQQELGFSAIRAGINVFQLLGAIDVPGGIQVDFGPKELYKLWRGLSAKVNDDEKGIAVDTTPDGDGLDFFLGKTKFFPISSGNPSFFHRAQLDPERYEVDESTIPKKVILHMVDPAKAFTDSPVIRQAYNQFEHVTAIQPWMSETADLYADLIMPAATIEKYEGPISCSTPDEKANALRLPPVAPLWESKGEIEIYLDIAEKVGFLDGLLTKINDGLKLTSHALPMGTKPTERQIFDNWAKEIGETGIGFFESKGVTSTSVRSAGSKWSYASSGVPYHGARHRLYGEDLLIFRQDMGVDTGGVDPVAMPHVLDYTAFPTWREPTMWKSEQMDPSFRFILLSHKQIEFKQSRASFVPMLAELAPRQGLIMNPESAAGLGIADGDAIWVESHNAMTGETRRVKTHAMLHHTIRPDTVSMSHHYGLKVSPTNEGQGPSPNELYFGGEGYIQCTQDASFHVMVRVSRA